MNMFSLPAMPMNPSPIRPCRSVPFRLRAIVFLFGGIASVVGCGRSASNSPWEGVPNRPKPEIDVEIPENISSLVDDLYVDAPADRAYAASRIGALGVEAKAALPYLTDVLADADWQVRRRAAEALGAIGDRAAVDPLVEVLSDRDEEWSIRTAAARSLGRLGDARAVEALATVLNDMNAHVRHMAVVALGQIGTAETIEPLESALGDGDGATRFAAAEALREIRLGSRGSDGSG
jgi:HEAT repeat protein